MVREFAAKICSSTFWVLAALALVLAGGDGEASARNLRTFFDDLRANFQNVSELMIPEPDILTEPRLLARGLWEIARRAFG
ncbi:MAG: hypothetical protein HUK22_08095 [Thermoguttaceae bacterium]|nr:hypothetical protein [Thermoguttaceae bacterium]